MAAKKRKTTTKREGKLPHWNICRDCAILNGADMSNDIGGYTVHEGLCKYCNNEKAHISPLSDYHWPKEYGVNYVFD